MKIIYIVPIFASFILSFSAGNASASSTVSDLIKNQGGCFTVHYQFFEDGPNNFDLENAFERIDVTEDQGVIKVQHYGILNDVPEKHFREEWSTKDGTIWNQKVVGPAGDFRYECSAPFKFNQWRCLVLNAPKPRRDRKRQDYDVLDRQNSIQITPDGWVQSEVNLKKTRDGKEIATETGWVIYKRAPATACQN